MIFGERKHNGYRNNGNRMVFFQIVEEEVKLNNKGEA